MPLPTKALTVADIVVKGCLLVLFSAVFLTMSITAGSSRARSKQSNCVANLKQLYGAFSDYQASHNLLMPIEVPVDEGGAKEWCEGPDSKYKGGLFSFASMAESIKNPRVLKCPTSSVEDPRRWKEISRTNVTYFIQRQPALLSPHSILLGDNHIMEGNTKVGLLVQFKTSSEYSFSNELHPARRAYRGGNLLFQEGSVSRINSTNLTARIRESLR